jgi:hypothetical protein
MLAVTQKIKDCELETLVRMQGDELRKKDNTIAQLENMLEKQATELAVRRRELNVCRAQLELKAAV